jgi:hypothetical protein
MAGMQLTCGGVVLLIVSAFGGELDNHSPGSITAVSWAGLAYLTIAGSVVAFTGYVWLLDHAPGPLVATYNLRHSHHRGGSRMGIPRRGSSAYLHRPWRVYLRLDPTEELEAVEAVVPPELRRGRFKAPDALIASLLADISPSTA